MDSPNSYQALNQLFIKQSVAHKVEDFSVKIGENERLKVLCSNFIEDYALDLVEIYTYRQFREATNAYDTIHSKYFNWQEALNRIHSSDVRGYAGINRYDAAEEQTRKQLREQFFWWRMPQKPAYTGLWQTYGFDIFQNLSGAIREAYNIFSSNSKVIDSYIADYNAKKMVEKYQHREIDAYAELDVFGRKMEPLGRRVLHEYGLPFSCLFSSGYNPYMGRPTYTSTYYRFVEITNFIDSIVTAGFIGNSDIEKGLLSLFLVYIKRAQQLKKMETPPNSELRKLSVDEYIGAHAAENQETMAANLAMLKLKPNDIYFITKDYYINYIKEYLPKYQQLKMLEKLEKKHSSNVVMNISQTDLMTGNDFEYFVADILNKMGYKAQVTKATGDQGLDIIAVKGTFRLGVQTKRWSGSVGNKAIQETVAGKAYYNVDQVLVVTNSYFTNEAIALARANNVMLWDRHDLEEKLKNL